MKTRVKPCENCGGKIGPDFYIVKLSQALVDPSAVNRYVGMTQYFQGHTALADVFATDKTLEHVMQGEDANQWPEMIICLRCFAGNPILAQLLFDRSGEDDQPSVD